MTVRAFTVGSLLTALSTWAIGLLIVIYLDPTQAGLTGFFLFFLVLFLAIASSSALLGYAVRRYLARRVLATYAVRTSLRQGIILGLFFDVILFLQLIKLYVWWLAVIAIVLFLTIEFFFLSYDRSSRRRASQARTGS